MIYKCLKYTEQLKKSYMPNHNRSEYNLLNNNPDGLGKHISVEIEKRFTEQEIITIYSLGELPFYFEYNNTIYAVEVGGDIILNLLEPYGYKDEYGDNPTIACVPDLDTASKVINNISWYLDQMYAYLNIDKNHITVQLIGYNR